jgi:L-ribulose-5-phosphate 3-epimerase
MSASKQDLSGRLAVCSWSLQPASADDLFQKLAATGISRVSIALDPIRENAGGAWSDFQPRCARHQVTCVSGMMTAIGEDYSTLESIKRTGGVVPDEHWEGNWRNFQANAELATQLGLKFVMFHAGFLPHDPADPAFAKLLDRLARVAGLFAARGIAVGFETGQETGETLAAFLEQLNRPNVGINFDPANMILYDKGDPIAALRTLGRWLRQCHLKDAVRTRVPGTWGEEVVVGTGQVNWPAFFGVLRELGFRGDLCLEREAGTQRVADLRAGREHLERLLA